MGKQFFTTNELAETIGVKPDTIRRGLCTNGHYLGVRPVKLQNRRLLWPGEPIVKILDDTLEKAVRAAEA